MNFDYLFSNYKTSLAGLALIILGVLDFFGNGPNGPGAAVAEITAGLGMLFAKDGNVTGGNVRQ